MRTSTPRLAALAAAALLLAACGEGEDADAPEAEEAEEVENDEDDDAEDESDESEGDGSAWAVWDGEEYEFDRVSCSDIVEDNFQIRASGADLPGLQVRFPPDDQGGHHFDEPSLVEIFFDHGETIGDGEGYEARGDDITGVSSDGSQVAGELHLDPDSHSGADEVNPDGGTLEFEMVCP